MGLHDEHRKRVKNHFINKGLEDWEPHQILELLLFYAIPQKDTNELAHRLINHFGSLHAVFEASFDELITINGIGEHAAVLLSLILPVMRSYRKDCCSKRPVISSSEQSGNYLSSYYLGCRTEKVCLMSLDARGRVLSVDTVCEGDITSALFSSRKVLEIIMRNSAAYIVLAHNHPSDLALPSSDDIKVTQLVVNLLSQTGVKLIDHIIFGKDDFVSLCDSSDYKYLFE